MFAASLQLSDTTDTLCFVGTCMNVCVVLCRGLQVQVGWKHCTLLWLFWVVSTCAGAMTQCAEQVMRHICLLSACQIGQHCSSITALLSTRQYIFRPNTGYLVCVAYRSLIVDTPFPREFFEIALEFAQFPGMAGLGYPLPWNS